MKVNSSNVKINVSNLAGINTSLLSYTKNINSYSNYKFDETSIDYGSENNDNSFGNLTDEEYNTLASITARFSEYPEKFVEGKKLSEVVEEIYGKETEMFSCFENFEIVEMVNEDFDFSALVLKDDIGNYTIIYPSTKKTLDDILYDAYPLLVELGFYDMNFRDDYSAVVEILDEIFEAKGILKELSNSIGLDLQNLDIKGILAYIEKVYTVQRFLAFNISQRYCMIANREGSSLNFFGYSKGGGMAEYAYLQTMKFCARTNDSLGDIVVYNPYHDNLSDVDVGILKESGDFSVYRQQGDCVSAIFNDSDFENETTYVKCDWESCYGKPRENGNILDNIDRFPLIFGGPHAPALASSDAFDENGNALYAEKIKYEDVFSYLFNVKDPLNSFPLPEDEVINGVYDVVSVLSPLVPYFKSWLTGTHLDYVKEEFKNIYSKAVNVVSRVDSIIKGTMYEIKGFSKGISKIVSIAGATILEEIMVNIDEIITDDNKNALPEKVYHTARGAGHDIRASISFAMFKEFFMKAVSQPYSCHETFYLIDQETADPSVLIDDDTEGYIYISKNDKVLIGYYNDEQKRDAIELLIQMGFKEDEIFIKTKRR